MKTVKETVNELNESFSEFKSSQEQRMGEVEKKNTTLPNMEEKLSRIEKEIGQASERLSRIEVTSQRPFVGNDSGLPENNEHKSAFLNYISKGDENSLTQFEAKSLSVSSDPDGGYSVPDTLHIQINRLLENTSTMRRLSKVLNISTDAVDILVDQGDAEAGWVSETADRNETDTPKLVKIKIPVHELYAKPRATQKLLDDSRVDVESWLAKKIAHKFSKLENQAFIQGDGDNKPKGLLNYELSFDGNEEGKLHAFKTGENGGFAGDNPADVLIDMINAMKPELLNGCVWLMSRSAHGEIRKLKDAQGNYLWQPGIEKDARPHLLGYPVEICDALPALSADEATSSVVFGNFQEGYQVVDRSGIRVLRDPYSVKPYVEFYTTCRVGGDIVNLDAFKILNFSE